MHPIPQSSLPPVLIAPARRRVEPPDAGFRTPMLVSDLRCFLSLACRVLTAARPCCRMVKGVPISRAMREDIVAYLIQVPGRQREFCLLVLNSVTSTPQWIRQPKLRDVVYDVCVFVCHSVLRSPRALQPLDIRLCPLALIMLSFICSCRNKK